MTANAVYYPQSLVEFQHNPLIGAVRPRESITARLKDLMIRPPCGPKERMRSKEDRLTATQRVVMFHQPSAMDLDLYTSIDNCLRWGYVCRNPLSARYANIFTQLDRGDPSVTGCNYLNGYKPKTYGFSVIGISGIGKSTTVDSILDQYDQVITHESFEGNPFVATQITWLKFDCPVNGSLKAFCESFFRALDKLLGTTYAQDICKYRNIGQIIVQMERLVHLYHIGLLILDELQHLVGKDMTTSNQLLNFFVSLVNTLGIPIITIGTPKARILFEKEFQQAKRGSGQGDFTWDRMKEGEDWTRFVRSMWQFQYTQIDVPFSDEMAKAFFEEAQGIPYIAVHLYKLVQQDAILSGKECFEVRDIHRMASRKMKLTEPMRKALRYGNDLDLEEYIDIRPLRECDYPGFDITPEKIAPAQAPAPKESLLQDVVFRLSMIGISKAEAQARALAVMDQMPNCKDPITIAKSALAPVLAQPNPTLQSENPLIKASSYQDLEKSGLVESSSVQEGVA